jgi:hypothetical protein
VDVFIGDVGECDDNVVVAIGVEGITGYKKKKKKRN